MLQVVSMRPEEFRSWFAGYSEHISDAPTPQQWARIQAQVRLLAGSPSVMQLGQTVHPLSAAALAPNAQGIATCAQNAQNALYDGR